MALGLLIAIVITGAAVRLTGSGLGCDDWPNCNDERLVDVSSSHAAIEQVNRLFTGLVSAAVIAAVLGSLWRRPRRRDLVWLSLGLVAGVLGQIVLGGILVIFDLHPILVQGHMILSLALVGTAVVLLQRAGEPDGVALVPAVSATARRLIWALAALTGAAILAGTVVTAAGPHAGDEDVSASASTSPRPPASTGSSWWPPSPSPSPWRCRPRGARPTARSSGRSRRGSSSACSRPRSATSSTSTTCQPSSSASTSPARPLLWAMTVHLVLARRRPLVPPAEGGRTHRGGVVTSAAT